MAQCAHSRAAAMTSPKCSSVCRGGVALLFRRCPLFPRSADAAPILLSGGATDPATGVFVINPVPSTEVTGAFEFDNDVALFQFLLGPGTFTFTAATTSAANSFDPILKLFAEDGTAVTYTADDGGVFEAVFFGDIDELTCNCRCLPWLVVQPTRWHFRSSRNFPNGALQDGFDASDPAFSCFTMSVSTLCQSSVMRAHKGCLAGNRAISHSPLALRRSTRRRFRSRARCR